MAGYKSRFNFCVVKKRVLALILITLSYNPDFLGKQTTLANLFNAHVTGLMTPILRIYDKLVQDQ